MSAQLLLQHLREATEEGRPLFEYLCELGDYCCSREEKRERDPETGKTDWAKECAGILLESRFILIRDALTSAAARVEDLRRKLEKRGVEEGALFEHKRLLGFLWCLEALYGPDDWMHDMAIEFRRALMELDLLLMEQDDLGLGKGAG